jgi:hypothetical protein
MMVVILSSARSLGNACSEVLVIFSLSVMEVLRTMAQTLLFDVSYSSMTTCILLKP